MRTPYLLQVLCLSIVLMLSGCLKSTAEKPAPTPPQPVGPVAVEVEAPASNEREIETAEDRIQKHLIEYQKAVIEKGLPVLPVALPEEDIKQLEKEGFIKREPATKAAPSSSTKASPKENPAPDKVPKSLPQLPVAMPQQP